MRRRTTTSSGELLPHIAPLMKAWYLSAKYFWCLAQHHKSLFCADQLYFKRHNIFVSVASLFDLLDLPPGDFFWSHFTCSSPDKVKCHIVNPAFMFCLCLCFFFITPPHPPISTPPVLPLLHCPSLLAACCHRVAAPQALAQAIKEAKEQHPDMSVTRVVVHKETELAEEEDWLAQVEKTDRSYTSQLIESRLICSHFPILHNRSDVWHREMTMPHIYCLYSSCPKSQHWYFSYKRNICLHVVGLFSFCETHKVTVSIRKCFFV